MHCGWKRQGRLRLHIMRGEGVHTRIPYEVHILYVSWLYISWLGETTHTNHLNLCSLPSVPLGGLNALTQLEV